MHLTNPPPPELTTYPAAIQAAVPVLRQIIDLPNVLWLSISEYLPPEGTGNTTSKYHNFETFKKHDPKKYLPRAARYDEYQNQILAKRLDFLYRTQFYDNADNWELELYIVGPESSLTIRDIFLQTPDDLSQINDNLITEFKLALAGLKELTCVSGRI